MSNETQIFAAENGRFVGAELASSLSGYTGSGYVTGLTKDGDYIEIPFQVSQDGYYLLTLRHAASKGYKKNNLLIDGDVYGEFISQPSSEFKDSAIGTIFLRAGDHTLSLLKSWGQIEVDCVKLQSSEKPKPIEAPFDLVNPNATEECKSLMRYLKDIYGDKILTGQHTVERGGPEIDFLQEVTGKRPALRGFDLLGYSLHTETENPSEHKVWETEINRGSIESAIDWSVQQHGIVTFCWHWYAPTGGEDKSFYTKFTDYDLASVLEKKDEAYDALIADIDEIGGQLKKLQEKNIPVLWRPLHEADGGWFWWGAKGAEPYKKLYRLMYDRYTNHHKLNNLIWVWNAPNPDWYPGDDVVDIAGADIYGPGHNYGPLKYAFDELVELVDHKKPVALTENGTVPDPEKLQDSGASWLWYMTWCGDIATDGEKFTSKEHLRKVYQHANAVTLDELPDLKNY